MALLPCTLTTLLPMALAPLQVLTPLLVESLSPPSPAPTTPALHDTALRLVTTLPTSAAGARTLLSGHVDRLCHVMTRCMAR